MVAKKMTIGIVNLLEEVYIHNGEGAGIEGILVVELVVNQLHAMGMVIKPC